MVRKKKTGATSRPVQVGVAVQQALGEMLLDGSVKDPRVREASMVTITDVRMTPDLKQGRVFVSVYAEDEATVERVFEGLRTATPQIKRELADRLKLRFTPDLTFVRDESISRGMRIEALLKEIDRERADEHDEE